MATVDVTIGGRSYQLACEDGQERRLAELARIVDAEMRTLSAQIGAGAGEARLLLMTALVIADRLDEAEAALGSARASGGDGGGEALETAAARLEALIASHSLA